MAAKFHEPNIVEEVQQASPPSACIRMRSVEEVQQALPNAASMSDLRLEDKTPITSTISSNKQKEDDRGGDRVAVGVDADPFYVGNLIGKGGYGRVYVHYDDDKKLRLAVKKVDLDRKKNIETKQEWEAPYVEVLLMRKLKHGRIVEYVKSELCIYMELMEGGCVKDQLVSKGLGEATTKTYTRQLLEGLYYLHEECDIMHLDVKSANLLCDVKKEIIKISDFGVSKHKSAPRTSKRPGTYHYMAPEIIGSGDYCEKVDIWSTGATIVEMLTTNPPWHKFQPVTAAFKTLTEKRADYILKEEISVNAKDFLNQAFNSDGEFRPSAGQLLGHLWLSN